MFALWIDMIWYCSESEVLRALAQKSSAVPEPFPQNAQYKSAVDEEEDGATEIPTKNPQKKKQKSKGKKRRRVPAQVQKAANVEPAEPAEPASDEMDTSDFRPGESYTPQRYSFLRKQFVGQRMAHGVSWKTAQGEWNNSRTKAQLLSSLGLPELKRRRFVSKHCTVHPWQWQVVLLSS